MAKRNLVFIENNTPVTTSLIIAKGTKNEHESVMRLLQNYMTHFERWGQIYFTDLKTGKAGRPTKVALLNEQQATFLLLLLKNSEATIKFKMNLIDLFYEVNGIRVVLKNWVEQAENNNQPNESIKCVYILQMENGRVKIGVTNNFKRRLNAIRTSSNMNIDQWCHTDYLPKHVASEIECSCHKTFRLVRDKGEFFQVSYEEACTELRKYAKICERSNNDKTVDERSMCS